MKTSPARLVFLFTLATALARADDPLPPPRVSDPNPAAEKPSADVSQRITGGLPKYDPTPAATAPAEPKPGDPVKPVTREDIAFAANPDNADVLVLPKMTVKQKPRPRLTPEVMATSKALGEDLMKKHGQFDRALNRFTLPLFGASAEQQALEDYRRERAQELRLDVLSISQALQQSDPAEAKALEAIATKP